MIGDRPDEFAQRNVFLHLALGLLAASRRIDGLLARYARSTGEAVDVISGEDEALIEFVLGLVSFRNRAVDVLTHARVPTLPEARADAPLPNELLR